MRQLFLTSFLTQPETERAFIHCIEIEKLIGDW